MRGIDTVARLGSDEFVLVLPELQSADAAGDAAQRVPAALAQPYAVEDHELRVTPSIGISLYPRDGENALSRLECTDVAVYCAKRAGHGNFQLYSPDMKL